MTADEARQLARFARRLNSTPRNVLSAALRMTDQAIDAQAALAGLRVRGHASTPSMNHAENLLLTPIADFARTEVADALAVLWRDAPFKPLDR